MLRCQEQIDDRDRPAPRPTRSPPRVTGVGRLLIAVYGVLALAATGRSRRADRRPVREAPVAFSLSALAAVVYIVATIALIARAPAWYRVAWITIGFEMAGVLASEPSASSTPATASPTTPSGRATAWATCSSRSCCRFSACGGWLAHRPVPPLPRRQTVAAVAP